MKNLVVVSIILLSCVSTKKISTTDVCGVYFWKSEKAFESYSRMEIKSDNTFIYEWSGALTGGISKGTWELEKNLITFNSDIRELPDGKIRESRMIETSEIIGDSIIITILDESRIQLTGGSIILLKESLVVKTLNVDESGFVAIDSSIGDELQIKQAGFKDISHTLEESGKKLVFQMARLETPPENIFVNEQWKYENDILKIKSYSRKKFSNRRFMREMVFHKIDE